jgi:hypothetical protein
MPGRLNGSSRLLLLRVVLPAQLTSAKLWHPPAQADQVCESRLELLQFSAPALRGRMGWLAFALLPVVAVAVAAATVWPPMTHLDGFGPPRVIPPPTAPQADDAIRIIAGYGRAKYIDHDGHTWLEDHFFEGVGNVSAALRPSVALTADPPVHQSGRLGLSAYNIPQKAGIYELKLHFVERDYGQGLATGGGENSRVMDITAGRW